MRTYLPLSAGLLVLVAACVGTGARPVRTPPIPNATFLSDGPVVRAQSTSGLVLRKTTDAFKTFGGYDVAYTGQTARWTFTLPDVKVTHATLVVSMNADDHATSIADYRYTLWSGDRIHRTPVPLAHGTPANAPFDNWIEVSVPADVVPGETFSVSMTNASTGAAGTMDWIAVRWVELRLGVDQ